MIAPLEASATKPKLSSSAALLSFFNFEIPTASERMNGTARIPVVAPEASKEIAKNSLDVNSAKPKTSM